MRIGRLLVVVALVTGTLALGAVGAPSAGAVTQQFTASTSWTVPAGVTCVTFDLVGARGGNGGANQFVPALPGAPGGLGGEVEVELAVTANATLTIDVGTRGGDGGGAIGGAPGGPGGGVGGGPGGAGLGGGGGGGGGASRVMLGALPILVAAGGGGGGASVDLEHEPGAGGIDEAAGEDGDVPPESGTAATGGGGATNAAGGTAGVNSSNFSGPNQPVAGSQFQGGAGGSNGDGGGGGGGGLFGGGGGGAGFESGGAGGGGGSNHAPGFATVTHGVDANNGGNGRVSVSYEVGDTSCIAAPLAITKIVGGGAPEPGTIVTVALSCTNATIDPSTVGGSWADAPVANAVVQFTIGADGEPLGGSAIVGFEEENSCTITETQTGGAVAVTYACSGSEIVDDSRADHVPTFGAGVATTESVCSSAGPQAQPITIAIVDADQVAEVTVTNVYPLPVLIPRFTG